MFFSQHKNTASTDSIWKCYEICNVLSNKLSKQKFRFRNSLMLTERQRLHAWSTAFLSLTLDSWISNDEDGWLLELWAGTNSPLSQQLCCEHFDNKWQYSWKRISGHLYSGEIIEFRVWSSGSLQFLKVRARSEGLDRSLQMLHFYKYLLLNRKVVGSSLTHRWRFYEIIFFWINCHISEISWTVSANRIHTVDFENIAYWTWTK